MNLDKKSLIQIVILVVLLIGGAAVYFMQQDGGLDFISHLFESEPATVRAPTPVARKPAPKPEAAPAPAAKPAANAIPDAPAQGQVSGKPFQAGVSYLENGTLVLQGQDATAVRITLPGTSWETPAGKKFQVAETDTGAPSVTLVSSDGKPAQTVSDKYAMTLEFGAEANKKLPGKIQLTLPNDTKVAGTFAAELRGFRIVDGKPDLSVDSVETLQFLALRELLKDDPNKALEVMAFRDGGFTPAGTGTLEVQYRVPPAGAKSQRFQFVKVGGVWKLAQGAKKK